MQAFMIEKDKIVFDISNLYIDDMTKLVFFENCHIKKPH